MSESDITSQIRDMRRIEYLAASDQLVRVREALRRMGSRLVDTGSCLVEADALDLLQIAGELERESVKLRQFAVELNSCTRIVAESIAEEIRA